MKLTCRPLSLTASRCSGGSSASTSSPWAAGRHRAGNTTHHQLWPEPSPITTRRVLYRPAGSVKPSYSLVWRNSSVTVTVTASVKPFSFTAPRAASVIPSRWVQTAALASYRLSAPWHQRAASLSTASRTFSFRDWSASLSEAQYVLRQLLGGSCGCEP